MFLKIRSAARSIVFPTWSIPIALLLLTILAYGLRALDLGFFWDDWPYLWFFHRFGPEGIVRAFASDRPFLSFIYITSLTVLGQSIQGWQIFALVARWLCSLGLWWALSLTWPKHKHQAAWAVFLFTVYPGFTQQWISVIYGQAFFLFAAMFFSIGITLWLARRRRSLSRPVLLAGMLLALALSAFTMFSTEYFFGLELLRPLLLWLIFRDAPHPEPARGKRKMLPPSLVQAAVWWMPYLALMIVFVIWRSFIHVFVGYGMEALKDVVEKSALGVLVELAFTIFADLIEATFVAWGQPLQMGELIEAGGAAWLRLVGLMLFTGMLFTGYLARTGSRAPESVSEGSELPAAPWWYRWGTQSVLVGLFAFLVAGWPFWITRLPMRMGFPQDRFSLALSVGVCLIIAGLVDLLAKKRLYKAMLLGLLIALAAGFHFNTGQSYRQDWNTFRDFFWQLTWRAPSVQPNTLFLSDTMPFHYFEDDSLIGPLNWTYDPEGHSTDMSYALFDQYVRLRNLSVLTSGGSIEKDYRGMAFNGSAEQVLVFYYAPPGCVHILDPIYDAETYRLPDRLLQSLPYSNPRQLIQDVPTPAVPPGSIFGAEPRHRWCYYYEKAELARQSENWDQIYSLSNQSIREGLRPEDPIEYLPFIEGYLHYGLVEDAYQLTQSAFAGSPAARPALCAVWRRSFDTPPDDTSRAGMRFADVQRLLGCSVQKTQ